jgi:hypothetical protein
LIELSIALNRTAMYPSGHPSLDEAAAVVVHHLATLLYDRPALSIGVARKQLVIEGVATDARNPVLRSLAERLHQHHIGAMVFRQGVAPGEVLGALRLLGREREREGLPLGLGHPSELEVGPHVRLYPLTFERLELSGDAESDDDEEDPNRGTRVSSLWIGLARAALATEEEEVEPARTEPGAVAEAINEHPAAQAYDQVIVGYLLQIANELKSEGGAASAAVRKRMSRLIGGLNDETLQRLVQMGGDVGQRQRFLLDAADGLAADAVVDLVRVAAEANNQSVSTSMLRILQKLSAQAETGSAGKRALADSALRDQIRTLVTDWTLDDPNPAEYTVALQAMASRRQAQPSASGGYPPEPLRIVQMALELGTSGPTVDAAVQSMLDAGRLQELVAAVDAVERSEATGTVWHKLGQPEHVLGMLAREPVDFALLDRVVARADPERTAKTMLDALQDDDSHIARSTLVRALGRLGPEVAVEAASRLSDPRPRVKRTVLALLNALEVVPEGVSPLAFARDAEAPVRREALLLALRVADERDRAIGLAVNDADERVVRVGVRAAQAGIPEAAVALLARRVGDVKLSMDLRVNVIRALGGVRSQMALDALLRVTSAGKTFLGRPRLTHRSPEMLAALSVLADQWKSDRKAAAVLKRARASGDPDLRAAAGTGE